MRHFITISILATAAWILSACGDVDEVFDQSMRSGNVSNEYVEAPLTEKAKKYEAALQTSNQFLQLWQQQDFKTIHETLVDPEVQDILTVEKLQEIAANVEDAYGPMQAYKPMQWAFEPKRAKKQYFLFSIKTTEHEKGHLNYLIQFLLDGGFQKIIGVYVRETPTLRAPGQIHTF